MRVLITNTRCAQAYASIRALRPFAERIVATMSGPRPLGIWPPCNAAYSRLVDARYQVPDPEKDWHEGRVQRENTAREQSFVEAVLKICEREKLDAIFPSNDPWTYVFSKNRELFARHGVEVPVPDYDTVVKPLDKYRTVLCAEEAGFPAPRTFLPSGDADVEEITASVPPPWVIKPRFTTGGRGLTIVDRPADLLERVDMVRRVHGMPIVQEYIPGRGKQNFAMVLDRDGRALSVFTPRVIRINGRLFRNETGACVSAPPHDLSKKAVEVVARMGWWGGATLQTKLDARDGVFKLMEVNPRLGTHLWYRTELGINEPLMTLKIGRGEHVEPITDYPLDYTLLEPIEDFTGLVIELLDLLVYRIRTTMMRKKGMDPAAPPLGVASLVKAYGGPYFAPKKRYSPYVRYALSDPLPTIIWTSKVLVMRSLRSMKGLGR